MRIFSFLTLATCMVAALAGCGEEAATKANKSAVLSGRQEVRLRLAHATEAAGDYPGAEKQFLEVVNQSPDAAMPHVELAEFYKRHREDQKAVDSLSAGLQIQPGNSDMERELANTYIGMHQPEKALAALNKAMLTDNKNPLLYNSRGVALDQMGRYGEAQASYRMAYDLDPGQGMMYKVNMSMSYIVSGHYDKAIALLRPMLDAPNVPPIVRQNLALAYGLKGDSGNALKLGLQDLSNSEAAENVRFYRMLARKHGAQGQPGEASVPASVVNELFPEEEPAAAAVSSPVTAKASPPAPAPAASPVKPVAVDKEDSDDSDDETRRNAASATMPAATPAQAQPRLLRTATLPPPNDNSKTDNASVASTPDATVLPTPVLKPDGL